MERKTYMTNSGRRAHPHDPRHWRNGQPGWRARRPPARLKRLARSRPDPITRQRKGAGARRARREVVAGDMDDIPSIDAAMEGAYGVFSVQSQAAEDDPQLEKRRALPSPTLRKGQGSATSSTPPPAAQRSRTAASVTGTPSGRLSLTSNNSVSPTRSSARSHSWRTTS